MTPVHSSPSSTAKIPITSAAPSFWSHTTALLTPYVLTECCYLVGKYLGPEAEINLVESVVGGDLVQVFPDERDMARIVELMHRYRGFPLGVADASVIAVAERLELTSVPTLDHRDFRAITPDHVPALTLLA